MDTATTSHSRAARSMSERWPSCSAPMVGTTPTDRPERRMASRVPEYSARVSITADAGGPVGADGATGLEGRGRGQDRAHATCSDPRMRGGRPSSTPCGPDRSTPDGAASNDSRRASPTMAS